MLKGFLKQILPPVIVSVGRNLLCHDDDNLFFYGDFASWEEAEKEAALYGRGYESQNIIETVAASVQKVRMGEAAFERDGVAFTKEDYNYRVLSALLYILAQEHRLNVCDFGGSLGSTYFQNRKLFHNQDVVWNVVEQEQFVDYGRKMIPEVNFYYELDALLANNQNVNCVLLSACIEYMAELYEYLSDILSKNIKYIIIDRVPFNYIERDRIVCQHVPQSIYEAVYPLWLIDEKRLHQCVGRHYHTVLEWDDMVDAVKLKEHMKFINIPFKGLLLVCNSK